MRRFSHRSRALSTAASGVAQERHEREVHVQLVVTVEERRTGIVGDKIERRLLEPAEHDDILDHPAVG